MVKEKTKKEKTNNSIYQISVVLFVLFVCLFLIFYGNNVSERGDYMDVKYKNENVAQDPFIELQEPKQEEEISLSDPMEQIFNMFFNKYFIIIILTPPLVILLQGFFRGLR